MRQYTKRLWLLLRLLQRLLRSFGHLIGSEFGVDARSSPPPVFMLDLYARNMARVRGTTATPSRTASSPHGRATRAASAAVCAVCRRVVYPYDRLGEDSTAATTACNGWVQGPNARLLKGGFTWPVYAGGGPFSSARSNLRVSYRRARIATSTWCRPSLTGSVGYLITATSCVASAPHRSPFSRPRSSLPQLGHSYDHTTTQ